MTAIMEPPVGHLLPGQCGAIRPRFRCDTEDRRSACILPLAHPLDIHKDQYNRTWIARVEGLAPAADPKETAHQLLSLLCGTLNALDRLARESAGVGAAASLRERAQSERWRVLDALGDMGLNLTEDQ
jgi:hypothetical protein